MVCAIAIWARLGSGGGEGTRGGRSSTRECEFAFTFFLGTTRDLDPLGDMPTTRADGSEAKLVLPLSPRRRFPRRAFVSVVGLSNASLGPRR